MEQKEKIENKTQKEVLHTEVLHTEVLQYLGKTFNKEGTRIDKEGKTVEWKLWKLIFKKGHFDFKVTFFEPGSKKSLQVSQLEEGKYYSILYKWHEFLHQEHGLVKSRQGILLKQSDEKFSTENNFKKDDKAVTGNIIDTRHFEEFKKDYMEAMEKFPEKVSPLHMVGAYLINTHQDIVKKLAQLCDEVVGKQDKKVEEEKVEEKV